jgi:DNA repair protein RadD
VVVNVGTLTTGIDWDVRCICMCRPTKSDMLFVQIIGRGLRTAEGKDYCLILDHSDNHSRLGFVTDIDVSYTGLHVGKAPASDNRSDAIRLPKECKKCGFLRPPRVTTCPSCGFKAEVVSKVETLDGELRELKPKAKKPKPWEMDEYVVQGAPDFTERGAREMFYSELLGYAQSHSYKPGWASNKYKEKVGVWPTNMRHVFPSRTISSWTAGWIKHTMIRWAKSKRQSEAHAWGRPQPGGLG